MKSLEEVGPGRDSTVGKDLEGEEAGARFTHFGEANKRQFD